MDDTPAERELPELWICPRCSARLVSRNLWHSCGQFSLENLFANADQQVLDLARRYVTLLHALGDVQVIPQKTRLVCVARVRFSGLEHWRDIRDADPEALGHPQLRLRDGRTVFLPVERVSAVSPLDRRHRRPAIDHLKHVRVKLRSLHGVKQNMETSWGTSPLG
ncbi:hypothetical protein FKR81_38330 [Lentzea tibetensis]|uniref:DUF5655 domain-containing protein n=1 Tax=Lentzea tibetensis TaxID=2591470 RepID=A0A563EH22_9PSEU|nr:hypothetical protein [Lentzea tibetensis]TWP45829.1 hypothetical protein FKR81_38330 [Lentzea tibetensis]